MTFELLKVRNPKIMLNELGLGLKLVFLKWNNWIISLGTKTRILLNDPIKIGKMIAIQGPLEMVKMVVNSTVNLFRISSFLLIQLNVKMKPTMREILKFTSKLKRKFDLFVNCVNTEFHHQIDLYFTRLYQILKRSILKNQVFEEYFLICLWFPLFNIGKLIKSCYCKLIFSTGDVVTRLQFQNMSDTLKWLHKRRNCDWEMNRSINLLDIAAAEGELNLLKWFNENTSQRCTTNALEWAAAAGHLKVVKYLYANSKELKSKRAVDWACRNGHLSVVKYLCKNGFRCSTNAMDWACQNGHLRVVKFLHLNSVEGCTSNAMDWAAANGHIDILHFLHTNRREGCTTDAMDAACRNGHFNIVNYLHMNRNEGFTVKGFKWALEYGNYEIVEFLKVLSCKLK
jgi:hypothetical protein